MQTAEKNEVIATWKTAPRGPMQVRIISATEMNDGSEGFVVAKAGAPSFCSFKVRKDCVEVA
jgi:hypothetical protein